MYTYVLEVVLFSLLLVDDEKLPREIIKEHINWKSLGVDTIYEAEDGREGLEIARKKHPDIIISDVRMPHMDGMEMASSIRKANMNCRFVFLSGYSDKQYLKEAIKLKVDSYVEKPIDLGELYSVLLSIVSELKASDITNERLIFFRSSSEDFSSPLNDKVFIAEVETLNKLEMAIIHKDKEETESILADMYTQGSACEGTDLEYIRTLYCTIINFFLNAARNRNMKKLYEEGNYLLYTGAKETRLDRLKDILQDFFTSYFEEEEDNSLDIVTRVDNYLNQCFTDKLLSVNKIADSLDFAPNYLCSAYKKQAGQSINSKIIMLRISKAKELLLDSSIAIKDVHSLVGYNDEKYFSRLFAKNVGLSPKLYRERNIRYER